MTGILNLHKPSGITSRQVVDRVAALLPRIKVGHAGTLDPLASGVLVVCVGVATRLVESIQRMIKTYHAVILLGARSDTLDADGRVTLVESPRVPSEQEVRQAIAGHIGMVAQLPPEYSALWVKGQRAYDLARAGQAVDLQPRLVRIDRAELVTYRWPRLALEINCGAGTYIRSVARDLGETLGCGGLIEKLVRTRIGPFELETTVDPMTLTRETLAEKLYPLLAAVPDLPVFTLSAAQAADVIQGRNLEMASLAGATRLEGEIALVGPDGRLIAVACADCSQGTIHPRKVFADG
jgi:tRNA pseudouridine55 synthase